MRRKRPYTEPDRIKERIKVVRIKARPAYILIPAIPEQRDLPFHLIPIIGFSLAITLSLATYWIITP